MPAKPLIAIVEDDESLRPALVGLVRSFGYDGEGFESAEAFLAANGPARAACLVSDFQLPGISGIDLIAGLGGNGPPAILVTARHRARPRRPRGRRGRALPAA
ncbi:MAG: response regulator [Sphingomonas sp.]